VPAQISSNSERLDGIDVLRGLAILLVMLNHFNLRLFMAKVPYTAGLPNQLVSSLVWNGQRGVQIFFAVSGFLITSVTLRRWSPLAQINVRAFYRIRFARIAPLLLMLLAVLTILDLWHVPDFVISPKTGGLSHALLAALTFHINVLEAWHGYLPANWDILWSLSLEEVFYLFFPLLCWMLGRSKPLIAILCLFVVLGPFARSVFSAGNEVWYEYSYLGGMDAIALGCLTALLVSSKEFSRQTRSFLTIVGLATLTASLCLSLRINALGLKQNGLDMTILAAGACMIIAVAAQSRWRSPIFLMPIVRLGQRSYEIYLTHMFIVFALFHLFLNAGKPLSAVLPLFMGTIILAGILGEVVARYYSEPVNRILRAAPTVRY